MVSTISGANQKYADTIALNARVRKVCSRNAYPVIASMDDRPAMISAATR